MSTFPIPKIKNPLTPTLKCKKCHARFWETVDPLRWFCSPSCKLEYKPIEKYEQGKPRRFHWRNKQKQEKPPIPQRRLPSSSGFLFYRSPQWLHLRYRVLKEYGRTCMACGTHKGIMQIDHIKPRSKYPELALEFSNMQVLCIGCNNGKGTWDETDWR